MKIRNRIVSWTETGLRYEADPRHVEIMASQMGLTDCKTVMAPGINEEGRTSEDGLDPLEPSQETIYRALVARANYISPDRPDIGYAVKELAKSMSCPKRGDWCRLKRLLKYPVGRPILQTLYRWQDVQNEVTTYSDADWAGNNDSRKSTSGGCITIGEHTIKGWSKTQSLIALSSGESELYATLKAASEILGIIALAEDLVMHEQRWV